MRKIVSFTKNRENEIVNISQNRRFLEQNVLFFARSSSHNYRISSNVKDIRRKWDNFGPFLPKIWGPF